MNALARIHALPKQAPLSARAARAIGRETFINLKEVELTGDPRCGAALRFEVEFYCAYPAIPGSSDEPGEPAQYEIAAVRPFRCAPESTVREYLDCPAFLEEMLIDCVDIDSLDEAR